MPHLIMSTTSSGNTARPSKSAVASRPEIHRRSSAVEQDLGALRRQVAGIIEAILSDTKPEEASVREKLRWHVANNPGQPEKALLSHLLTVSADE